MVIEGNLGQPGESGEEESRIHGKSHKALTLADFAPPRQFNWSYYLAPVCIVVGPRLGQVR